MSPMGSIIKQYLVGGALLGEVIEPSEALLGGVHSCTWTLSVNSLLT